MSSRSEFDLAKELPKNNPAVASIFMGQCLARIYFHLQQGWLVYKSNNLSKTYEAFESLAKISRVLICLSVILRSLALWIIAMSRKLLIPSSTSVQRNADTNSPLAKRQEVIIRRMIVLSMIFFTEITKTISNYRPGPDPFFANKNHRSDTGSKLTVGRLLLSPEGLAQLTCPVQ